MSPDQIEAQARAIALRDIDWDSNDVVNLRTFLDTNTGAKILPFLTELRPSLTSSTIEQAALAAKKRAGYELAVSQIVHLAYPPKEPAPTQPDLPSLTDESQWDGFNPK